MENKKFIDVLFENRNKKYGAYELRKTENNSLMKALLAGVGIVILSMGGFVYSNKNYQQSRTDDFIIGCPVIIDLTTIDDEIVKPPIEDEIIPTEIKREQLDTKQIKEIIPEPTRSPKKQETIVDKNETVNADLGVENREGTQLAKGQVGGGEVSEGDKNVSGAQNNKNISTGNENIPSTPTEIKKILTTKNAKVMAIYPGCEKEAKKGNDALTKCLSDKLSYELINNLEDFANNNADNANAKMQFIISKNGEITQIKSANGSDTSLGKEAKIALEKINKNLIRKGKRIIPAQYDNGTNADLIFTIPVRFQQM